MGVQFGICSLDDRPVERKVIDAVRPIIAPYGPDDEGFLAREQVLILHRALHTTKESRNEVQPHLSSSGLIMTWDGRLDNREELVCKLGGGLSSASTDLAIAACAYEKWGTGSFENLIGDWVLSVWDPRDQSLTLAKDFSGVRQLFYLVENQLITWCTVLEPLLLIASRSFAVEAEYVAGWLSQFPRFDLTPYAGVRSVPPGCFLRIRKHDQRVSEFWNFSTDNEIRYRTDRQYEEHFHFLLSQSVKRRLRSETTIVAELSGGMDSSSIVCLADELIRKGVAGAGLETLSYYDNSEPNWNELPYLSKVEEKLERRGHHIDVSAQSPFQIELGGEQLMRTPTAAEFSKEIHGEFHAAMLSGGSRVLLTGTGGDEVTGGVPTPLPELQDLLASARFKQLAHQLKNWALNKRRPWVHLLIEAVSDFLPSAFHRLPKQLRPAPWINKQFVRTYSDAFAGYDGRLKIMGSLPSFQQNIATFNLLRRQLGCEVMSASPPYEKRYPYLDRDFVEFMYAIPRDQVVRPGQRRSLMRRALAGIVPIEVLERRRKAYVTHAAIAGISAAWANLQNMFRRSLSEALGLIEGALFVQALDSARRGKDVSMVAVGRTLLLEVWLRNLEQYGIVEVKDAAYLRSRPPEGTRSQLRKSKTEGGDSDEIRETGNSAARISIRSDSEQRHSESPKQPGRQPEALGSSVRG